MIDPILIGLGLFIGTLVGLTGVGGGALLTPLLILFVGVKPMTAVGTDLAFAAITKGVGAFQHMRHGKPDLRLVYRLLLGSIPGAILGSWLMSRLHGVGTAHIDAAFTSILGFVLIISAIATILQVFNIRWIQSSHMEVGAIGTAVIGGVVGILVGCTSIGAGSLLMAMIGIFFRRLPISQAVGVDVAHGAMLAMVAAMAHGAAGRIEIPMVMNLLVGSLPGVLAGSWLCNHLPARPLRVGVATMLALSGMHLL
jgi:uncharacterized membrane protein YfcA